MGWIEVNFSCFKYRDWHWLFKKFLETTIAQSVTKESKGANHGERAFIYG